MKNIINKHGILLGDTYNFDETGFQMGQISASKVVTAIDRVGVTGGCRECRQCVGMVADGSDIELYTYR